MSDNKTTYTMNDLKLTGVAIPVQFHACLEYMRQHIGTSGSAKISMPLDADAFKNGQFIWDTKMNEFTKADIHRGLTTLVKTAQSMGIRLADGLPTKATVHASKKILGSMHTFTRGQNVGKKVFHIAQIWKAVKDKNKSDMKAQALETAKKFNMQVYVKTVTLKDGTHRAFTNIQSAQRAYCRQNFGAEWHTFDKENRMLEALTMMMKADDPEVITEPTQ